jgi:hypothetical protein
MRTVKCINDKATFGALYDNGIYEVVAEGETCLRVKSNKGDRTFSKDRFEAVK